MDNLLNSISQDVKQKFLSVFLKQLAKIDKKPMHIWGYELMCQDPF